MQTVCVCSVMQSCLILGSHGLCTEGSSPGLSLYGLLGLLYGMADEFQEQASHEQQTEAVLPFMTQYQQSCDVHSITVTNLPNFKRKTHISHLLMGGVSKSHCRRTRRTEEIGAVVLETKTQHTSFQPYYQFFDLNIFAFCSQLASAIAFNQRIMSQTLVSN